MRQHRFITAVEKKENEVVIKNKTVVNQVKNVLRLKLGDIIVICDGKSQEWEVVIKNITPKELSGKIVNDKIKKDEEKNIALYMSVIRKEKFEWVVEKATEIGVSHIVPMITARTLRKNLPLERLGRVAKEAAEQSERGIVPVIESLRTFKEVVGTLTKEGTNILCDMQGKEKLNINSKKEKKKKINILIGPEGGWSDEEKQQAKEAGIERVSLGNRPFRAETAAIIATWVFCQTRIFTE